MELVAAISRSNAGQILGDVINIDGLAAPVVIGTSGLSGVRLQGSQVH